MNLGVPELLIILAIILLVFGSTKVPQLFRSLGQAQREFKAGASDRPDDEASPKDMPPHS